MRWFLAMLGVGLVVPACILDRGGTLSDGATTTSSSAQGGGVTPGEGGTSTTTGEGAGTSTSDGGAGGTSTTTTSTTTTSTTTTSTTTTSTTTTSTTSTTAVMCGDGAIGGLEKCDDKNLLSGDGCDNECHVEPGYECSGQPSTCTPIAPVVVQKAGLAASIPDNGYDGNPSSMLCVPLTVSTPHVSTQRVTLEVGIDHKYVSDVVIKLQAPDMSLLTVVSRPTLNEAKDDGKGCGSNFDPNLVSSSPITFRDDAPYDAETMGSGLNDWEEVCKDDNKCDYKPNPGKGPGVNLAQFNGKDPNGTWQVCIGDGCGPDTNGKPVLQSVKLSVLSW